jgi:hypothetical protein
VLHGAVAAEHAVGCLPLGAAEAVAAAAEWVMLKLTELIPAPSVVLTVGS